MVTMWLIAVALAGTGGLSCPDDPPSPTRAWSEAVATSAEVGTAPVGKWIRVDLATQTLVAHVGDRPVMTALCSTGRLNATPRGVFRIREKRRYNVALARYGSAPIPYSLRLDVLVDGRRHLIAIHEHSSVPRRPASHGCIRLKRSDAARLFGWAEVGVPVEVD